MSVGDGHKRNENYNHVKTIPAVLEKLLAPEVCKTISKDDVLYAKTSLLHMKRELLHVKRDLIP